MGETKTESQHTPTPWEYEDMGLQYAKGEIVITSGLMVIAELPRMEGNINNAAFIVRAVNSHEALLKLAKEYRINCQDRIANLEDELKEFPNEENREMLEHWRLCLADTEKAIAQAEGE